MLWNRAPDKTPIPHFAKDDPRNAEAARARLANVREAPGVRVHTTVNQHDYDQLLALAREQAVTVTEIARRLIATALSQRVVIVDALAKRATLPFPVYIPSERIDPLCPPLDWRAPPRRPGNYVPVTATAMGDPAPARAASGGFLQRGWMNPAGQSDSRGGRLSPYIPIPRPEPSKPQPLLEKLPRCRGDDAHHNNGAAFAITTVTGCRFPTGDPRTHNFYFCNAKISAGRYCAAHAALCRSRAPFEEAAE